MKLDLVACHIDSYGVENWYDKPRNNTGVPALMLRIHTEAASAA